MDDFHQIPESEQKQALPHYWLRAKAYMQLGRWADAEAELLQGLALAPQNADALFEYAQFHFMQWQRAGVRESKWLAIQHAGTALSIEPQHAEATALINQIRRTEKKLKLIFWIRSLLAVIVVPAMAALAILFLQEEGWVKTISSGLEGASYKVPATFIAPAQAKGINFSISSFYVKHGETSREQKHLDYYYTGVISSDSFSIERLSCNIQFISEEGEVLAQEYAWFLNAGNQNQLNTFRLYPGDQYFFHHKQRWGLLRLPEPERIARVSFQPDVVVLTKPHSPPAAKHLPFNWQGPLPKGLQVEAFLREDSLHLEPLDSVAVHFLQMELHQTGGKACQEFVLLLSWKDANGKIVKETDIAVVTAQNRPWRPGQRIAVGWQEYFNNGEYNYPKPFEYFYVRAKATMKDD